jgi:hypothetical protein
MVADDIADILFEEPVQNAEMFNGDVNKGGVSWYPMTVQVLC